MPSEFNFTFGSFQTRIVIRQKLPELSEISGFSPHLPCLAVCDEHTEGLLQRIVGSGYTKQSVFPLILPSGEQNKTWNHIETILKAARKNGLGRDGLFLAVGGGVLCDLTAFAASVYMRGAGLTLIPTTLLAMADASLGGKTGFDLEGIKNFAGTFYPASEVFITLEVLKTLPEREWKSGIAEIIKAAILDTNPKSLELFRSGNFTSYFDDHLEEMLTVAVKIKGNIVEADPRESTAGTGRALLNLGHTFGHALESACGLGLLSHGEAVAWGIARSCELGAALGITPPERAKMIKNILTTWGYDETVRFNKVLFREALQNDKKKKAGKLRFVIPNADSAEIVEYNPEIERYLETL